MSRADAAIESAIARWIAVRPLGARTAELAGGPVRVEVVGLGGAIDPHAAIAELRIGGLSIPMAAAGRPIRRLAQRLLGGPDELDAPRPLTAAEHAIWALVLAAAIEDTGVSAEVWPALGGELPAGGLRLALRVDLAGAPMTVVACCPPELTVRPPPPRPVPAWPLALSVIVGRTALTRAEVRRLAVRDVITIERGLALWVGDGAVGLRAAPGAIEAEVATGYVGRDMGLPDEAHLELTVELGTTRLTLRQLAELAIGQIVPLGRPLAGPYEIRAAGQPVGQGELVDVDGELGVRIVSLISTEE